ncbi:hypothetical protein FISHEDRAFT_54694, partial [Fistulina hepatica ATCC 64428]
ILRHDDTTRDVLDGLRSHAAILRIAGFASAVFAAWAPRLFGYYLNCLEALLAHDSHLFRLFSMSVWAAVAYNFGPQTVTWRHRDFQNIPFGWCCITALGRFNHHRSGHLVLWNLRLVIEFPPGSTVLIPSAIVDHSNTKIAPGETRYSITQYSPGGLFRWVDCGFQKQQLYFDSLDEEGEQAVRAANQQRWKEGLSYFSTLNELENL